jgi:YVTN family beta-propeller protein
MDPAGNFLYVTLNGEGKVAKVDLRTGQVVAKVSTGSAPRSMTIAPDGRSLYVVNYESNTVSKLRASDMKVLQTVPTNRHPIGITYDGATGDVWVACYTGTIMVFRDG